ncbi:MAG: hypothetical protein HY820_40475 [Acidobacteria bacterium]|nr:hypothetical protein [Acidobacteriota bacterium]
MLWKLVRIDPCFPWVVRLTLVSPLLLLLSEYSIPILAALYSAVVALASSTGSYQRRASLYQTALPLPARTIWLSRVVVHSLLFAVPGVVFLPKFGLRILAVMVSFAVLHAVLCTLRPERDSAPGWWILVSSAAFLVAMGALQFYQRGWLFLAVFAVILALYGWTWTRLPAGFQLASERLESVRTMGVPATAPAGSGQGWLARNRPFLKAFVGWQPVVSLGVIALQGSLWSGEAAFTILFVPSAFSSLWDSCLWMEATPTPRRRIFAWVMGVPLALYVSGFAMCGLTQRTTIGPYPVDAQYLTINFALALLLLVTLVQSMNVVQRRLQMSKSSGYVMICLPMAAILALFLPLTQLNGNGRKLSFASKGAYLLSRYLTDQPLPLSILCALCLIGVYLYMERDFQRADVPCRRQMNSAV